jgi:rhamnose transport system substrate-binding protein
MKKPRSIVGGVCAVALLSLVGGTVVAQSPDASTPAAPAGEAVTATPGQDLNMLLLPKFLGILPFDLANKGANEAATELQNPTPFTYTGPTADNSVQGQIETLTNAPTQGFDVVMLSNNAGDQIGPVAEAAQAAGTKVVTWDSEIPSAQGESVFVSQVDIQEIGTVLADLSLSVTGGEGGHLAILSASPDAANQNAWNEAFLAALEDPKYDALEYVETVYGNDQSEESYNQALALVDKYPDLRVIQAPTSVGIVAAAKALQDEGLCDQIKVTGLGVPPEMLEYTLNGCAPEFALWSFVDLGYLTYYTSYLLGTGAITGADGESFVAGRMGEYTITTDPNRDAGLRVLMGPFSVYNIDNIEEAAVKESLEGSSPAPAESVAP